MRIPWPFLRLAPEDEDVSKHLETVAPLPDGGNQRDKAHGVTQMGFSKRF